MREMFARLRKRKTHMKLNNINNKLDVGAGCVVFNNKSEVLLIMCRRNSGSIEYQLPKGRIENRENDRDAAKREVLEETGIICNIINNTPTKAYKIKPNKVKLAKFYLALYESGKPRGNHSEDIVGSMWANIKDASVMLTDWQKPVLQKYKNEIYKLVRAKNESTTI